MSVKNTISWIFRLIAAVILLQTLYFKFTAHPQSVKLFTAIGDYIGWSGANPYMRVGTGVMELITGILLLLPSSAFLGAFLGLGVISGALATHLFIPTVGINFDGDPGLFILAVIVFLSCLIVSWIEKEQGIALYQKLFKKASKK